MNNKLFFISWNCCPPSLCRRTTAHHRVPNEFRRTSHSQCWREIEKNRIYSAWSALLKAISTFDCDSFHFRYTSTSHSIWIRTLEYRPSIYTTFEFKSIHFKLKIALKILHSCHFCFSIELFFFGSIFNAHFSLFMSIHAFIKYTLRTDHSSAVSIAPHPLRPRTHSQRSEAFNSIGHYLQLRFFFLIRRASNPFLAMPVRFHLAHCHRRRHSLSQTHFFVLPIGHTIARHTVTSPTSATVAAPLIFAFNFSYFVAPLILIFIYTIYDEFRLYLWVCIAAKMKAKRTGGRVLRKRDGKKA